MRFIGHLDLQQLFERALRRSALPLRYSQGFSPKVRLNLAGALPLGFTSTAEMMDFWLEQRVEPPLIQEQLNAALPTGIRIISVTEVPNDLPSLQASLKSAEYEVSFKAEIDVSAVNANLEDLLNKPNLIVTRRNKQVDLKPLVEALHWEEDKLYLRLSSSPEASARPDELLALLDLTTEQYDIQRIGLYYS
jgi:radical SAM-linked protein